MAIENLNEKNDSPTAEEIFENPETKENTVTNSKSEQEQQNEKVLDLEKAKEEPPFDINAPRKEKTFAEIEAEMAARRVPLEERLDGFEG